MGNRLSQSNGSVSNRFIAFDIKSPFFALPARQQELAELYRRVFNEVGVVSDLWSEQGARNMVAARFQTVGCNIALVDVEAGNKVIGAFFSNIVPGPHGWKLVEPDVLIDSEYRGRGLGSEMGWLGRRYANDTCFNLYGEHLETNDSKTYAIPTFPKGMWKNKGYQLRALYAQNARQLVGHHTAALESVVIEELKRKELPDLVHFISDVQNTRSADGQMWSAQRAEALVDFMLENNFSTSNVAKVGNTIVAISAADIMPERTGPTLVDSQCFVKSIEALNREGLLALTSSGVAAASYGDLLTTANGVSKFRWHQGLSAIEIPERSAQFFREILPGLTEDRSFVGMEGAHDTLIQNLRPKGVRGAQITLVPSQSGVRAAVAFG